MMTKEEKNVLMSRALERIGQGDSLRQIAEGTGVDFRVLRQWLLGTVPEQYRELQELGLIQRIIDCDEDLDSADSLLEINRADKQAKYARWDAERRLKHLFAPRVEQEVTGQVTVKLSLQEAARRIAFVTAAGKKILDGEATRVDEFDVSDMV